MQPIASLNKLGFRRWYERSLIEAHAWLVSCFLALLLAGTLFEAHNETSLMPQRVSLLFGSGFALLGAWSGFKRYRETLLRTESFGHAAECPQCGVYGKFSVLSGHENAAGDVIDFTASCRKCGHRWRLEA